MIADTNHESIEKRHLVALHIALSTGLLKKCLKHGEVYDPGQRDYQGACMVATFLINRDDPLVAPFAGDRALPEQNTPRKRYRDERESISLITRVVTWDF